MDSVAKRAYKPSAPLPSVSIALPISQSQFHLWSLRPCLTTSTKNFMPTFVPCMTFDSLSLEFDGLVSCLREGHDSVLDKHGIHTSALVWSGVNQQLHHISFTVPLIVFFLKVETRRSSILFTGGSVGKFLDYSCQIGAFFSCGSWLITITTAYSPGR